MGAELVRQVVKAIALYEADYHATTFSPKEVAGALVLNETLTTLEKTVQAECEVRRQEFMRRQTTPTLGWEAADMELTLSFHLNDTDTFADNEAENVHDYDRDAEQVCIFETTVFARLPGEPEVDPLGLGEDCNDMHGAGNSAIHKAAHCFTFHRLYHDFGIPFSHMWRIGRICWDLRVTDSYEIVLAKS